MSSKKKKAYLLTALLIVYVIGILHSVEEDFTTGNSTIEDVLLASSTSSLLVDVLE